jgi:hypothetical protein
MAQTVDKAITAHVEHKVHKVLKAHVDYQDQQVLRGLLVLFGLRLVL